MLSSLFQKSAIKFLFTILFATVAFNLHAQVDLKTDSVTSVNDSIVNDSIITDSVAIVDSVKVVPKNEGDIKSPINYSAKDSMEFSLKTKMMYAFGDAKLSMDDMKLDAGYVKMNMDSNYIYAQAFVDEKGQEVGQPVFTQGSEEYEIKTIKYNFETKKGVITDVVTEQNGGFLHGGTTKMQPNKEIHIVKGKYTTCDADHPHFYVYLHKAKAVPEEKIITGPFFFVISDIPVPVGLPWGYFPSQETRTSGIILPSYGEEKLRGFYLQQGGYYWATNDNMDMTFMGDVYTSGSWTAKLSSKYKKRYKYSGSLELNYSKVRNSEKGLDDYGETSFYGVRLNYSRDPKANPTSTFNTNVNFKSSQRLNQLTSYDAAVTTQNQASSSIAYTKRFPGTPFNLSINARGTQNFADSTVDLSLPTMTFNMAKQFPFKRKKAVGAKRWYESISVGFNSQLQNSVRAKQSILFTEHVSDKFKNGFKYDVPVSTSFTVLKYLNLSPSISYTGRVYNNYLKQRRILDDQDSVVSSFTDTITGLNHVYDFNMAASLSTKLYGIKNFKRGKIAAIRHVASPSVSYSFRPDFSEPQWGFYEADVVNSKEYFSTYQNGVYGTAPKGKFGTVGFRLDNNFEMKTHSNDTTEEFKKIVLLNNLGFGASYNRAVDSLRWSDITVAANTRLFKQISVTYSGAIDLYLREMERGQRINKMHINEYGKLGDWYRHSISMSGSINSDTFKKDKKEGKDKDQEEKNSMEAEGGLEGLSPRRKKPENEEPVGDYDFEMPWNLSINYSFSINRTFNQTEKKFESKNNQSLMLNGGLTITKNWKLNGSVSYDFDASRFVRPTMNITRDLHCWGMSLNFIPFGDYKMYNFKISVKSQMFEGLEYKQQQHHQDNFEFF